MSRRPPGDRILGIAGFGVFLAALQGLPALGLVSTDYLPTFSSMATALAEQTTRSEFWTALRHTVTVWAIGLLAAMVGGVVIGLLIGSVEVLRSATATTVEFLRPIPSVALIPLVVLMFGTQMTSVLVLVVYAAFWQILVQVLYGAQHVDPVVRDTARAYGFSRSAMITTVLWPTALPFVVTGFRLAATVALILTITGELIIGSPGVGEQIATAQSAGNVEDLYGLVVLTGLLGVLVNVGSRSIERRALHWHSSQRAVVLT